MADKNLTEMILESAEKLSKLEANGKCVCGGKNALSLAVYRFDGRYYAAYFCPKCRNALKRLGFTEDNAILEEAKEWQSH